MKKIITIISAIVLIASFTSCEKLEGTAKIEKDIIDTDWKLETVKLLNKDSGLQDAINLLFTLTNPVYDFKEDGTYEAVAKLAFLELDPTNGTWELSEDGKVFTLDSINYDLDVATNKNLEFSASMEEVGGLLGVSSEEHDDNRMIYVFEKD